MNGINCGDIWATDWGGSPHAFKVVKVTAKTVVCRELELRVTSHDGYGQNGECIPTDKFEENGLYGRIICRVHKDRYGDIHLRNKKEDLFLWNYHPCDKLRFYTD